MCVGIQRSPKEINKICFPLFFPGAMPWDMENAYICSVSHYAAQGNSGHDLYDVAESIVFQELQLVANGDPVRFTR